MQRRLDSSSRNGSSSGRQKGDRGELAMAKCAGGAATGPIPVEARREEGLKLERAGASPRGASPTGTDPLGLGRAPDVDQAVDQPSTNTAQPLPSPSTIQRRPKLARLYRQKRAVPLMVVPFTRSASPSGSCTITWDGVMPTTISQ